MALTRNFLKSMGLTDEQVNAIIENHTDTVEGLKAERDGYKATAEKQTQNEAEITRLTNELAEARKNSGDAAKVQADFDAYKQQVETDKTNAAKTAAVRKALKAAGVQREEFIDLLLGKVDLSTVELEGDAVKETDKLIDPMKESFAGCFAETKQQPLPPNSPPPGGGGNLSRAAQLVQQYRENLYGSTPTKE